MIDILVQFVRSLPLFKGKFRIARLLLTKRIKGSKGIIILGKQAIKYKVPNINEIIGFSLYINGEYESNYTNYFASEIPRDGIFFDIGANIGTISIPLSKLRPDITIYAFEASPTVFGYLEQNINFNNCANIKIYNKAVTNINNSQLKLFIIEEMFGKGSIGEKDGNNFELVQTITINEFVKDNRIEKIDCIKIDVEGHEKQVLEGMNELIKKDKAPTIVFEFDSWAEDNSTDTKQGDAQALLMDNGYKLFIFNDPPNKHPLHSILKNQNAMLLACK